MRRSGGSSPVSRMPRTVTCGSRASRAWAGAVDVPLVVQDAPTLSGVTLSSELLARLVREVAGIQYLKIEALPPAPKIAALARLLAGDAKGEGALIGGAGGLYLVDELRRGPRATMP